MPSSLTQALHRARKSLIAIGSVKPWKVAVVYLVAALGPFITDHVNELVGRPSPNSWYAFFWNWMDPSWFYQRTLFGASHGIAPDFVSVVLIRPGHEPEAVNFTNVCMQREFLSRVIDQIALAHPAVIAIDKSYGCSACPMNDTGTVALRKTVASISRALPMVIGLRTEDLEDIAKGDEGLATTFAAKGMSSTDQILLPSLDFDWRPETNAVKYGLIRIDKDIRRVPLGWKTYRDRSSVDPEVSNFGSSYTGCASGFRQHDVMDTLSVAAARAFNARRLNAALLKMQGRIIHPFVSFFREDDLKALNISSAIEVLCGTGSGVNTDWRGCKATLAPKFADLFRNRVVFVGEQTEEDFWTPVNTSIPGVVLQASYTESLIEQKYLRPVAAGLDVFVSLAWLLVVELIFRALKAQPERALLLSLGSSVVLMLVFYRFLIVEAGIYFNL